MDSLSRVEATPEPDASSERTRFKGFWHGEPLPPLVWAALSSFVNLGHRFDLYCYADFAVPSGVTIRDAREVLPEKDIFLFKNPQMDVPDLGPFSDLFRFKLLLEKGGWYMDVDTFCLSDSIPSLDRAWARENPNVSPGAVGAGQIAFPAGDRAVEILYERCKERSRSYLKREALGPNLISEVIEELGLPKDCNGSSDSFYPVPWIEMFMLWLPEFYEDVAERIENAIFLPFYMSLPRYLGISQNKLPPVGSYLWDLCKRHAPETLANDSYGPEEIQDLFRRWFIQNEPWAANELFQVSGETHFDKLKLHYRLELDLSAVPAIAAERAASGYSTIEVPLASDGATMMPERPDSHLDAAVAGIDAAITALFRERERIIGASAEEAAHRTLVAPFSVPFAVAERHKVGPYEKISTGLLIGFEPHSQASIFASQVPKTDNTLSPPDHHYILRIDIENPGTTKFITIERAVERLDTSRRYRATIAMKAKANRPSQIRFELSTPQSNDDDHRTHMGTVPLGTRFEPVILSQVVDLTSVDRVDDKRNFVLIAFLPVGAEIIFEIAYYNVLMSRL